MPSPKHRLQVRLRGSFLDWESLSPKAIEAATTLPAQTPRINERGELELVAVPRRVQTIGSGLPLVPHTLLDRIRRAVPQGLTLADSGHSCWAKPIRRDGQDEMAYSPRQQSLLQLWSQGHGPFCGQIVAFDAAGMYELLIGLLEHLNNLRIAVVVATEDEAVRVGSYIDKRLYEEEAFVTSAGETCRRIEVGTPYQIMRRCSKDEVNALIYWGPQAAMTQRAEYLRSGQLARAHDELVRCYMLRLGGHLSAEAQAMVETAAGPVIYAEVDRFGTQRQRNIVIVNARDLQGNSDPLQSVLAWKRQGLWNNTRRNELIQQCAESCESLTWERYAGQNDEATDGERTQERWKVVVLVENREQAQALRRQLPKWEIRDLAPAPSGRGLHPAPAYWPSGQRQIVTLRAAERYSLTADVVIRADGTATPWRDNWLWPEASTVGTVIRKLVIDFDDSGSKYGTQMTRARFNGYESTPESPWYVIPRA